MANAKTPADLTITPRDRRFGREGQYRRWWLNNDPIASAFYNALSVTFPKGEGFFVESVRAFRDGTPPQLEREINAFVKQEVIHTREHVAFNRHVTDQGYDISLLETHVEQGLALTRGRPKIANLAATMCLEHFTAIIANQLIGNDRHLAGGDPDAVRMWRWHAMEEIEHKGVAYDTWLWATRDWSRRKRWQVKSLVMLRTTINFFNGRRKGMMELLRQDGLTGAAVKWRLFKYAFGNPGMARKVAGAWIAFFLPGFHPWNHDDRALIAKAESEFAAAVMPVAA